MTVGQIGSHHLWNWKTSSLYTDSSEIMYLSSARLGLGCTRMFAEMKILRLRVVMINDIRLVLVG